VEGSQSVTENQPPPHWIPPTPPDDVESSATFRPRRRLSHRRPPTAPGPAHRRGDPAECVAVRACPRRDDPAVPVWATRTIASFTRPGDRSSCASLGSYRRLPGEAAALLVAAVRTAQRAGVAAHPEPRRAHPLLIPTLLSTPESDTSTAAADRAWIATNTSTDTSMATGGAVNTDAVTADAPGATELAAARAGGHRRPCGHGPVPTTRWPRRLWPSTG